MSFIEFVGLVISLAAMIFLVLRRVFEEQQRRRNPEEYARKEKLREENLRRLMKSRGIDFGDEADVVATKKPAKQVRQPVQAPVPQQTFVKVQKVLPKNTSLAFQEGDFGRETASAKRQNLAASDLKLEGSYEVIRAAQISPGNRVIDSLRSSRDMLVIKEIFDKPLSMRDQ